MTKVQIYDIIGTRGKIRGYKIMNELNHIEDFLTHLKLNRNLSNNTISAYGTDLKEFAEYKQLMAATRKDVENYVALLSRNNAPASVCRKIASLKSFYRYMVNQNLSSENPADNIDLPKIPKKIPVVLNREQVKEMFNSISGNPFVKVRDKLIINLLVVCGMRKSELLNIKLADIDLNDLSLKIRHGKGDKERYCYYNEGIRDMLKNYINKVRGISTYARTSPYLFVSQCSEQMSSTQLSYIIDTLLENIGAKEKGVSVHTLRRTCATNYYEKGVDIYTIKNILGHENITTTERYVKASIAKQRDAVNKIMI